MPARSLMCNILVIETCVDIPVMCGLEVCFLDFCRFLVISGTAVGSCQVFSVQNCTLQWKRAINSQWRLQPKDAAYQARRPPQSLRNHLIPFHLALSGSWHWSGAFALTSGLHGKWSAILTSPLGFNSCSLLDFHVLFVDDRSHMSGMVMCTT